MNGTWSNMLLNTCKDKKFYLQCIFVVLNVQGSCNHGYHTAWFDFYRTDILGKVWGDFNSFKLSLYGQCQNLSSLISKWWRVLYVPNKNHLQYFVGTLWQIASYFYFLITVKPSRILNLFLTLKFFCLLMFSVLFDCLNTFLNP